MEPIIEIPFESISSYIDKYIRKRNKSLSIVKRLVGRINKYRNKLNEGKNIYLLTNDINETRTILLEELSDLRLINHDLIHLKKRKSMLGINHNKVLELRDLIHGHVLSYDNYEYPSRAQLNSFNTLYTRCQSEYIDNYPRDKCNSNTCTHHSNNWKSTHINTSNDNLPYNTGSLSRYVHDNLYTNWYKVSFN